MDEAVPRCTVMGMEKPDGKRRWALFATLLAVVKFAPLLKFAALAAKFKSLLLMITSLGAYTLLWGWRYAAGFMVLLFIHELGHVIELRRQGVRASLPMFIPFLGAFVAVKDRQADVAAEARSAMAGPLAGLAASGAVLWLSGGSLLLQSLAYSGFLLNLFNLAPLLPLDGGRVAGALSPKLWLFGMVLALLLFTRHPSPVLLLVLILGGLETVSRWRTRHEQSEYYTLEPAQRRRIAMVYAFCLLAALIGMEVSYVDPAQLR